MQDRVVKRKHQVTHAKFVEATDRENKPTLKEFWKYFNIKNATIIIIAWEEVSSCCMEEVVTRMCCHLSGNPRKNAGKDY
jgi:hypothetical protein